MFNLKILATVLVFAFAGYSHVEAQISENLWYIIVNGDNGNNKVYISDSGENGVRVSLRMGNGVWQVKTFNRAKPIQCDLGQGENWYENRTDIRETIRVDWAPGKNIIWCGDGGSNVRCFSTGNDLIVGGNGDDYIQAGDGADWIVGGDGDDTLWESHWTILVNGHFAGDDSIDWLMGGNGDDTIYASDEDIDWGN